MMQKYVIYKYLATENVAVLTKTLGLLARHAWLVQKKLFYIFTQFPIRIAV